MSKSQHCGHLKADEKAEIVELNDFINGKDHKVYNLLVDTNEIKNLFGQFISLIHEGPFKYPKIT